MCVIDENHFWHFGAYLTSEMFGVFILDAMIVLFLHTRTDMPSHLLHTGILYADLISPRQQLAAELLEVYQQGDLCKGW